jgi:hypothetical protein
MEQAHKVKVQEQVQDRVFVDQPQPQDVQHKDTVEGMEMVEVEDDD